MWSLRLNLGILQLLWISALSLTLAATATATNTSKKTTSTKTASNSHKSSSYHGKSKGRKSTKPKAQQGIDAERTRQIQQALIREHYLTGEPTGTFDEATKTALARYQEENGWQTKSLPDSRALIKLGLGPDKKGLLNPDTAVMTSPHELGTTQGTPGGSSPQ